MKFKLIGLTTLVSIMLLGEREAIAQHATPPQYFVPTIAPRAPNTAALEKYGSYDVNMFTGVPNISIPLYTIESGDLKIPITLSYHASGIKVTEIASWVGLGWSISAGGTISRRIQGLADDGPYGYLSGNMKTAGTYPSNTDAGMDYLEGASNGLYDTRPDIYSYDFPGHSGKFFFNGSDGVNFRPTMIPYAPIKVGYLYDGVKLNTFNVTDEHGTKYRYGDGNVEISSTNAGGTHVVNSITGWQLKSMTSQNNRDTVAFTYADNSVTYPIADSEIWTVLDQIYDPYQNQSYQASYSNTPTTPGTNSLTQEKLLQHIYFKNGRVDFTLDAATRTDIDGGSSGAQSLNNIKVYKYNFSAKNYELLKTIQFFKSYFINPNEQFVNGQKRLRLDSLQIIDQAGTVIQHYRFDYNTTVMLPAYTSKKIDYWGYYNGKNNNYLTPQMKINFTPSTTGGTSNTVTIGSNISNGRDCDSTYMQAYMLTSIHYPTGGHTDFSFQTNQYYNNSNQLRLAGGLRVTSIKSYDGINPNPVTKTYQYNSADSNFIFNYAFYGISTKHRWYSYNEGVGLPQLTASAMVRSYVSNPRVDLEPFDAAPVKYHNVTEYTGNPTNNTGMTNYLYIFVPDYPIDASLVGGDLAIENHFFERGELLTKTDFMHKPDGTYQPVKSVQNTYGTFAQQSYQYAGLLVRKINYNEGPLGGNPIYPESAIRDNDVNSYIYQYYWIQGGDDYLKSTTTSDYDLNDPTKFTTSTVQYKYDNFTHQQVSRTYHTDSKGNSVVTRSKYPADYFQNLASTTTNNAVLDTMLNHNMQAEVIEKYDTVKNVTTGVTGITNGQLNYYSLSKGNMGAVVPDKIAVLNTALPLTDFVISTTLHSDLTGDARYTQMISFDNYDIKNNLIRYRARNAIPVSIFWDYQYALPIAQIQGIDTTTTNAQVAYTSFETGNKNNWSYSGTPVANPNAPSGSMIYPLNGAAILSPIMDLQQNYILSYWSNGGAAAVGNGSAIAATAVKTVNGWTYYEHQIPGSLSQVNIAGTMNIDELRLYNKNAQMTTYAYNTAGLITTMDTKNMASYYTYDGFQRLYQVKDQFGNIVKQNCYNYAGQATNCAIPYVAPVVTPGGGTTTPCTGQGYAVIDGQCQLGQKAFDSSTQISGGYACSYHYEWTSSSGTITRGTQEYSETHSAPCAL